MDDTKAKMLVENLLDRLVSEGPRFRLPDGIISTKERAALAKLAGIDLAPDEIALKPDGALGGIGSANTTVFEKCVLDDSCIDKDIDNSAFLCIDFGTAFSKASLWKMDDDAPIPLDLGVGVGAGGLLVDSAAFIVDGKIYFGPEAILQHSKLADADRLLFASPKELLTHDHERFHTSKPENGVDPTGSFKSRDLLSLYLAFLTAISCERAAANDIHRHVIRRFAAPGWSDSQISASSPHFENVAKQMNELLVDAQVLADSLPRSAWLTGLDVGTARSALDDLGSITAERKAIARFVERPVLEAVAAAAGVQDRLANRRPQVLVIDVGAGTTDIGVFKYSIGEGEARVATYTNGLSALQMAGNRLDDALIELAWTKGGFASDSQLKNTHARKVRMRVRDLKREIFIAGQATIEVDGFPSVTISQAEFENTRFARFFVEQFEQAVKKTLNGAGVGSKNFLETSEPNIVVFTGGGGSLPMLRRLFEKPIELDGGQAFFEMVDPMPAWVDSYGPDVQQVFPQLAVSTGGCAPNLPDEKSSVRDTSMAVARSLRPMYR